jgi:hypothetical protein
MRTGDNAAPQRTSNQNGFFWNLMTIFLMLAMCAMVAVFVMIFLNPHVWYNPFPPQPLPEAVLITPLPSSPTLPPTESPQSKFPATWTPTLTRVPTITNTPRPPTATSTVYVIPYAETQQATSAAPSPTITLRANLPFALRGVPQALSSSIIHPETNCNWMGIGGQAYDLQGSPLVGLPIQLGGTLDNTALDMLSLTGTAPQYYGPAGYEFFLSDKLIASKQTLWVQLLDQAGIPISPRVYFDTYTDCGKGLVLINFKQIR